MKGRARSVEEKMHVLTLAQSLGNVWEACRVIGIARSSFYEIKKAYDLGGEAGLEPKPRRKPQMPNAFPEDVVRKILEVTRQFPSYSCQRIALKLRDEGVTASASGVRKIWKRHGLTTRQQRIQRLREAVQQGEAILLSDNPVTKKENA